MSGALRKITLTHRCEHTETYRVAAGAWIILKRHAEIYARSGLCSDCVRAKEKRERDANSDERDRKKRLRRARQRRGEINQNAIRQVYSYIYGDTLPKGWRVEWAGFMRGAMGLCLWSERRIILSYNDHTRRGAGRPGSDRQVLATLVHEFVHVRHPELRHGAEFRRLERWALARLGVVVDDVAKRDCEEAASDAL